RLGRAGILPGQPAHARLSPRPRTLAHWKWLLGKEARGEAGPKPQRAVRAAGPGSFAELVVEPVAAARQIEVVVEAGHPHRALTGGPGQRQGRYWPDGYGQRKSPVGNFGGDRAENTTGRSANRPESESGRGDSNPRRQPWQGCTLPLSYSRGVKCGGEGARCAEECQGGGAARVGLGDRREAGAE